MNVEIGAEVALFSEKEYISGIFIAVHENSRGKVGLMAVGSRDDSPGAEEGTTTEWFGIVLEHQPHLRHHS
jgi:hypothetical protein